MPSVQTVSPGPGIKSVFASVRNDTSLQLGDGLYTVTPSLLNSNLFVGSPFLGATLANKTNLYIGGIPGQSIIDGSSAVGNLLFITNCSRVTFYGITFRGYTNHNFTQLPAFSPAANNYLWEGVSLYKSEIVTFENCRFERHADHGIGDKGAGNSAFVAGAPPSTNQIVIRNCYFEDIGSWRYNGTAVAVTDGTAIVPTGWTIEDCEFVNCLRGVEPYDENDATGVPFRNFIVRNCRFRNMVEFAVSSAGSTNAVGGIVTGNTARNETQFSFHGTNFGSGGGGSLCVGFNLNGGLRWTVTHNTASGCMQRGFVVAHDSVPLDDFLVTDNLAEDIHDGIGFGVGFAIGSGTDTALASSAVRRMLFARNRAIRCVQNGFYILSGRDSTFSGNVGIGNSVFYPAIAPANSSMRFGFAGLTLNKMTNCVARDNTMIDAGAGVPYGFSITPSAAEGMVFENNVATGFAANGGITNEAGNAVAIAGPVRSFSALLDFGIIGAASSQTLSISAPGVTTNDVSSVLVNNLFDLGATSQVIPYSWCSNAVVFVRLANNDAAGTVDFGNTRVVAIVRAARIAGQ